MMTELPSHPAHGRAVIIGASVTGLLAARVLAPHFERVTLLERDPLDSAASPRRGVPQGRHVHVLLIRGQRILRSLFPDLLPALSAAGADSLRVGRDLSWHQFNCWKAHFKSDLTAIAVSRPLLEHEIRRRVMDIGNVTIASGMVATRFACDGEWQRIAGVYARRRQRGSMALEPEELLHADLVIDASGRGSQTPQRLQAIGFEAPEESLVKVDFGYASRIYERPATSRAWEALYVVERPPGRRGGLIFPIENNRWIVTLMGWHGDHPPTNEAGFREFARSLPVPDLHAAIAHARPVTEIVGHGFPSNWRRHYERLSRFPAGLIVMGDALCSFNPVYGQGMTMAAIEAQLLSDCLLRASHGPGALDALAREFQRRAARALDTPWELATGEDLRFPQTPGRRSLRSRFLHWYTAKLHETAGDSPLVAQRFLSVVNMMAPRSALFRRDVLWAVMAAAHRRRRLAAEAQRIQAELASERRLG